MSDYLVALLVVEGSLLLLAPFNLVLESQRPYLTLFGGIALAIWLTRWKPAALAALVGFFTAHQFLVPGAPSIFLAAELTGYALSAGFILFMGESLHRSRERARKEALERATAEQSERARREQLSVTLSSIGDAVITTDAEGRITGLNPIAEAVTGWNQSEALDQPLDAVFRIVNESTRREVENPAFRALREGVIVGLANHTVLIRKDGSERPIDDSAAPIWDPQGKVHGCVLVFRDITGRRLAERQLWESREQLRITLASIGDGVIVVDETGLVLSINAEAEKLTGWNAAEAVTRHLNDVFRIVHEDTGEPVENPVEKVIELGAVVGLGNHTTLISKDGSRIPIDDSAAPIREHDGPLHGVVLIFRDVSQQRAAQRAQARLASIVEYSGDPILTKDVNGIVQSWNDSAERLFGYRPEEIVGKPITLIVPPERLHEEAQILARIRAGQPIERAETIRLTKAGRRIPVQISVSPLRDQDGRVVGASKIIHDITDVAAAREASLQSEQRFHRMADSAPVLIWISGRDKLCTWFNRQWLEFVGRSMEQEVGNGWTENVHADDMDACVETYVSAFDARTPFSMTYRLKRHDGAFRWVLDNGVPLYGPAGEFSGYIGSCVDITERQEAEASLQEVDRRKDEFLAILSHELRNPLAPIRMAVGMLRRTGASDPKIQVLRDTIERQTEQLTRLLDDLLDVSRIASGKIVLRRDRASLSLAIASAVESVRPQIVTRGHELILRTPEEPIYVHGDLARLAQVLANLLSNASTYTNAGGRITLTAEREDGEAVLRVRDTGIGLTREQSSKIFEMFAQVNPALERGHGGLGVGLSLSKRLIELHGGRIEVESAGLGKGSEFIVRLPLLPESATPAPREPSDAPSSAFVRHRVLVADDNHDAAGTLAMALDHLGYEVAVAHDGQLALESADGFQPDMAILDIGMPKINGYEVAKELRARFGRKLLLVAVTGWGKEEDKRSASEAGFDHHLTKPISMEALEKLLSAPKSPS